MMEQYIGEGRNSFGMNCEANIQYRRFQKMHQHLKCVLYFLWTVQ